MTCKSNTDDYYNPIDLMTVMMTAVIEVMAVMMKRLKVLVEANEVVL